MLGRTRTAQRVWSQASSLGRREFSKKHHAKHKPKNPAASEPQSIANAPSSGVKSPATSTPTSSAGTSENAGVGSTMSTSEILFLGSGALICTGLGYYVWSQKSNSNKSSGEGGDSGKSENLSELKWSTNGSKGEIPEVTVLSTENVVDENRVGAGPQPENDASSTQLEPVIDSDSNDPAIQTPTTQGIEESPTQENGGDGDAKGESTKGEGDNEEPVTVDLEPINALFQGAFGLEVPKGDGGANEGPKVGAPESPLEQPDAQEATAPVDGAGSNECVLPEDKTPAATISLDEPPVGLEEGQALAGALVKAAVEENFGAGENWEDFGAMHKQAESDARVFIRWQKQEKNKHSLDLNSKDEQIKRAQLHLGSAEKARLEDRKTFEVRYQQLIDDAELERTKALEQQESELRLAASEASIKERVARIKQLDEVRQQLNGLALAFKHRSKESETSHSAHKIALGVLTLEECLEHGRPCAKELRLVLSGCQDDPLVQATLKPLANFVDKGVPTLLQLKSEFVDVRRDALALGMLPKEGGGLIAQAVAKLGAMLKIDEKVTTSSSAPSESTSLDADLSHVEASLVDGDVLNAASLLEKATIGTAAECVTQRWITNAKSRAAAEQALKALHARATCLTLSLS